MVNTLSDTIYCKKAADEAIPPWLAPMWNEKISEITKRIQICISCITGLENHCSDNISLVYILSKIRSSVYRKQLIVALMMHLSQQLSGINAVSGKLILPVPSC